MTAVKKTCKNHASFTYSGKESSPLGLGYTAEAEEVGTVMEGRDKTMWMVGIKNGVKVWNRIPTQVAPNVVKPLIKEEVVMPAEPATAPSAVDPPPVSEDIEPDVTETPSPPPEADKKPKTKAPKKKAVVAAPAANAEEEATAEPVKKPRKKAVKKVPEVTEAVGETPVEDEATAPKKKPSDFNIYMSYRTFQLTSEDPSLSHKERFTKASVDWNQYKENPEEKAKVIALAKEWKAAQPPKETKAKASKK
jgi:hypothetical protein